MYNATEITFTDFHALMDILYNGLIANFTEQMNDEKNCMCHRALCHEICKFVNAARAVTEIKTEHTKLVTKNNDIIEILLVEIQKMKDLDDGDWLDGVLSRVDASEDIIMFTHELPKWHTDFIMSIDKEKHSIFVLWQQE